TKNLFDIAIEDHSVIKSLWKRFQEEKSDNERQKIANTILREVSIHSATEEIIVYPLVEKHLAEGKDTADHNRNEHLQIKKDLYKLDSMKIGDEGYNELLKKVMDEFYEHSTKEETDLFPQLTKAIGSDELQKLASDFEKTRHTVPTRAHPFAPDKPPKETIVGTATAPIDKALDETREFVEVHRSV
ncbi:6266_t:CDS:2, partial [Funneliformis geosporum]